MSDITNDMEKEREGDREREREIERHNLRVKATTRLERAIARANLEGVGALPSNLSHPPGMQSIQSGDYRFACVLFLQVKQHLGNMAEGLTDLYEHMNMCRGLIKK